MIYKKTLISILLTSTVISIPAYAQNAQLDEIVVTAQKKTQNIQDVPIAVTQVSGQQIKEANLESAADIQFVTPGLIVSYSSTNAIPNFSLRGVGLNDFTAVQSSPVAIHVDDVYLASSTLLNFSLFDVERVEVLKGPQGTLYGRNSTGGAVNFFSNKPTREFEAGFTVGYGNFEAFTGEGYISGPLSETLSGRLSVLGNKQNSGPYSHPVYGDIGKKEKFAARGQLLWEPTDDFDARLTIFGGSDNSDGNQYQGRGTIAANGVDLCAPILAGNLDSGQNQCFSLPPTTSGLTSVQSLDDDPFTVESGIVNRDEIDVISGTLAANYDFGSATLTSITGYAKADRISQEDADGTSLRAVDVGYETNFEQFSQELRLAGSNGGPLDWSVGASLSADTLETPRTETDLADIFGGFRQNHAYELKTDAIAIFTHNEYALSDRLAVVAGLRYTNEKRAFRGGTINTAPGVGPDANGDFVAAPTPVPNFDNATGFDEAYIDDSITFDNLSWRVGLNYDVSDTTFAYASISNGFKSGGFVGDITIQSVLEDPYDEEILTAYEVGIKTELADRRVRWNTSAFYYDYDDVILAVDVLQAGGLNTLFTNDNVSDAKIYGIETDMTVALSEKLQVRLAGTAMKSEQSQTVAVAQAIDGSDLPYAPELSGNASIRYEEPLTDSLSAVFQLDGTARSSHYGEAESVPVAELEGYGLINARVGLFSEEGWSVNLWAKNVTDKTYFTYVNDLKGLGAVIRTPGAPRTYGVELSYDF